MAFGAFQAGKSYRQLWRRPVNRTPPSGRGAASLVLGSDLLDETAVIQSGDGIAVEATGNTNDALLLQYRGIIRFNEEIPAGYLWRLTFAIGGSSFVYDFGATEFGSIGYPATFSFSDAALNISALVADPFTISAALSLELDTANPGLAATDVTVILPGVYIEQMLAPEVVANDLLVTNRFPAPASTNIPNTLPTIDFRLADVAGTGIDLALLNVAVDGVAVITAGVVQFPWQGSITSGVGPSALDTDVVLTVPATNLPYESEQTVVVNVTSALTGPVSAIDETWAFDAADTIAPSVQSANMISKDTLRVSFNDDVLLDATTNGALNAANYSTIRISVPAVTLDVVSVAAVPGTANAVDVTFNWESTIGAIYTIIVQDVQDAGGNILDPVGQQLRFTGFVPPRPRGRRFELLDFVPDMNIAEDATAAQGADPNKPGTGELRKFLMVLQDVLDLLLCQSDRWTDIIDIDLAPEPFLDAILQDLGNPFADCIADLVADDKRRLARVLISIYKEKGTDVGVINAIRFFIGVETTLDVINCRQFWQLDVSLLGIDTILAPGVGSPLWYSFYVVSPIVLTDEQRERILCIALYMKGVQEHVLGIIEPGGVITPSTFLTLNS